MTDDAESKKSKSKKIDWSSGAAGSVMDKMGAENAGGIREWQTLSKVQR